MHLNTRAVLHLLIYFQTKLLFFLNRHAEERKNISLSVVEKTSPVLISPTRDRARPPGIINVKTSFRSEQDVYEPEYINVPEPDYSPPPSPKDQRKSQVFQQTDQTKLLKSVINVSDNENTKTEAETRDSGVYNKVIKVNAVGPQQNEAQQRRVSGEYTTNIKVAPGAVNVMPKMNEIPKLKKVDPVSKKQDIPVSPQNSPREKDSEQNLSVKQIQENIENIYVNEVKEKTDLSPRTKTKVPPPIPTSPKAPPPPPSPGPFSPAPPPPPQDFRMAGGRLKQVHWGRVPKPLVRFHFSVIIKHGPFIFVLSDRQRLILLAGL